MILPIRRYVVPADASMSRAYRLFRTMGLRHMFVGPPQQKVRSCNIFYCSWSWARLSSHSDPGSAFDQKHPSAL